MSVGQGVGADVVTAELAEDSPARLAGAGVDQDVSEQVGVDRVRQHDRVQVPDAVGELLHAAERIRAEGCRLGGRLLGAQLKRTGQLAGDELAHHGLIRAEDRVGVSAGDDAAFVYHGRVVGELARRRHVVG